MTSFALAQRDGGEAEVAVTARGPGQPVAVTVRTDPEITGRGELFYFWLESGGDVILRGAVPPERPGRYRFTVPVPHAGRWGLSLRHGVGLELFYAFRWFDLDPAGGETVRVHEFFSPELGPDAPRFVQPLGFAVFAGVLVTSLGLVVAVLRWVRRQGAKLQDA